MSEVPGARDSDFQCYRVGCFAFLGQRYPVLSEDAGNQELWVGYLPESLGAVAALTHVCLLTLTPLGAPLLELLGELGQCSEERLRC